MPHTPAEYLETLQLFPDIREKHLTLDVEERLQLN